LSERASAPAAPVAAAQGMAQAAAPARKAAAGVDGGTTPSSVIRLQRPSDTAPYLDRLRAAPATDAYRIYLDERTRNADSTAFLLDVAAFFEARGDKALAVRVLGNLAEMDLENRALLRILGRQLLQLGEAALAVTVFERVRELAPDEPQSWRDLGLALAAAGHRQAAIDALAEVVLRPWHDRFPEIELVALTDLHALAAAAPAGSVDLGRLEPRLRANLPVDLRIVMDWDTDNTDVDLWVTDPHGERAFYGHRLTTQGGRMSPDFTGGYGPEAFELKQALPGRYRIEANFYGNRQQLIAGATTLQVRVATGFGTPRQRDRLVTLRLREARETIYVGEVDVG
jgi:tetratricopeptide (TPR) repeat protein